MFGRLGWAEILVIVVLLVILFGHKAIPGMMKNVANGINTFKSELKNGDKKSPARKTSKKGAENRASKNKLKK